MNTTTSATIALLLLTAVACAPRPPVIAPPASGFPPGFPAAFYAAVPAETMFRIDAARASVVLKVYRTGPLAALGHNHVIEGTVDGFVYLPRDLVDGRADLFVPVANFEVDAAAARAAAGPDFATQPTTADVEGTRANMLGPKLLDADAAPFILVHVSPLRVDAQTAQVQLSIHIRGHVATVPVDVEWTRDGKALTIRGSFSVDHATLGLVPFSALGGALRVAEKIDVAVTLTATSK